MLLAIDIGNTNVTLGAYRDESLILTARLATDPAKTADQYAIEIKDVLSLHGQDYTDVEDCIISCVVPVVGSAVSRAVSTLCRIVPLNLGPGVKTGLNIKIDDPGQLGADLVAAAVAALAEYTLPCMIVDMGTATTISVIDRNGSFLGGIIAAGLQLTLKALWENTSQLPAIHLDTPKSVIGANAVDSMRAGLVYGTASMLDGMIERIEKELGQTCTIVATGGLAREIIAHCKRSIIYNENLLLDGLREIYEKNS